MQSLTQKYLSVFEKSQKQIVTDGHSFVTAPKIVNSIKCLTIGVNVQLMLLQFLQKSSDHGIQTVKETSGSLADVNPLWRGI